MDLPQVIALYEITLVQIKIIIIYMVELITRMTWEEIVKGASKSVILRKVMTLSILA